MSTQPMRPGLRATLSLEYPMSLGVYDSYDDAQRAVDYLSDHEFPVQDVLIVGTDLKQLERVTGRLTRGRVHQRRRPVRRLVRPVHRHDLRPVRPERLQHPQRRRRRWRSVPSSASSGRPSVYRFTSGGQRDFTSVSLVVAAKYEVLCEHKHVQRGREMLIEMDPMRAAEQEVRRAREAEQARAAQQAPLRPQPWEQPQQPQQPQQSQQPPPPPVA